MSRLPSASSIARVLKVVWSRAALPWTVLTPKSSMRGSWALRRRAYASWEKPSATTTQQHDGSGLALHRVPCPGGRQYGGWQSRRQVRTQSSQSGVPAGIVIVTII